MLKNGEFKKCLICEKDFYIPKLRVKTAKYCSKKCMYLGLRGRTAWNKGKKLGFIPQMAFKKGQKPWHAGKKIDRDKYPNFGHLMKHTEESKKKMSLSAKGKQANEKNPFWKGENVGYVGLHQWIKRYLGKPKYCSINIRHQAKRYVWANISGEYKRELSDYKQLCTSCNKTDGIKINERFLNI